MVDSGGETEVWAALTDRSETFQSPVGLLISVSGVLQIALVMGGGA